MTRIDLFAHFCTQRFREAYLAIPLGAKGRRLDPIATRTFLQAHRTMDIDVLWDVDQRVKVRAPERRSARKTRDASSVSDEIGRIHGGGGKLGVRPPAPLR